MLLVWLSYVDPQSNKYAYLWQCYVIEKNIGNDGKIKMPMKYTGFWKVWEEDGSLFSEGEYEDGKINGVFRIWSVKGVLTSEWHIKDQKLNGTKKTWYDNGQLKSLCVYENNKLIGKIKQWDMMGNVSYITE